MQFPFTGDVRTVRRPEWLPRTRKPCFPILTIASKDPHHLIILSPQVEQVMIHVMGSGRTQPCTGIGEACWLPHAEYPSKPQYWIFVAKRGSRTVYMLSLTPGACQVAPRLLDPDLDLRGLELQVWRRDMTNRSPMRAKLFLTDRYTGHLEAIPSMLDQLGALWGGLPRKAQVADQPPEIQQIMQALREQREVQS